MEWDTAVALAYAAEQLFVAAQALTSDTVPAERALAVADAKLGALLDNAKFLPASVRSRVRGLHDCYATNRATRTLEPRVAAALAQQTMCVMGEIRDVLAGQERHYVAA